MKLTTGTYNGNAYSILIERDSHRPNSPFAFKATVYIADAEGEVIDSFIESGSEDWSLRNACIKRIITEA